MTFSPLPADLAGHYQHMGVEALASHLEAVAAALRAYGIGLTPAARVGLDEILEDVAEHHARHDQAALHRHLARVAAAEQQVRGLGHRVGGGAV